MDRLRRRFSPLKDCSALKYAGGVFDVEVAGKVARKQRRG
jgi:hypothetical protein